MKSTVTLLMCVLLITGNFSMSSAQDKEEEMKPEDTEWYEPVPPTVTPHEDHFLQPPSDATILFDGSDLNSWQSSENGEDVPWDIENGALTVRPGTGDIETKEKFDSFQLYIEWKSPQNLDSEGQDRGNSGIFLQGIYEIQVLDAYENPTYVNGMAGSVYKQTAPLVNPAKKPGEWQSFNIAYTAPEFNDDGSLESPARVTVIWNGVVVHSNTEIKGHTPYVGLPEYTAHGDGPIRLQEHDSEVSYRNIWIREYE